MGTWEDRLLDNDTALDGLGDLRNEIVGDIIAVGAAKPSATSTGKLCAGIGVLLQVGAYDFGLETTSGPQIVAAAKAHTATIGTLPAPARKVMGLVIDGKGKALAERPAKASATSNALLRKAAKKSPFGQREASLFATKVGAAYVQLIARRCVEAIDEDFEDESNWSDLCREGMGMGMLGVLMVLEPCKVAPSKLERWRRLARKGIEDLRASNDGELDFHEGYYANLDKIFAVLLKRFAS